MITFFLILILLLSGAVLILYYLKQRAESRIAAAEQQAASALQTRDTEVERARRDADTEARQARGDAVAAIARVQSAYDEKAAALDVESQRVREHYQTEAQKLVEAANQRVAELEPLKAYAAVRDAESEAQKVLSQALTDATSLRHEAQALLDNALQEAGNERAKARQRAGEMRDQAKTLLDQATRDAGRIVANAEEQAKRIGGDAYIALRDKQTLEQAVQALWNVTEGYGDRYVIPTHSLLDDLAATFGYSEAGQALQAAREQSRRMVEQKEAATCNYEEPERRERADRFIVDAFNGRVDGILSRVRHDNYGLLEQEIRDAFSLVNLNGLAFRDTHILPAYLEARLAELKWAVVVNELARKQREEQRYLKERMRDEEKARKEYEEKLRQAAREEELKRKAVEEAERKFVTAAAEQKAHLEQELNKVRQDLAEATQRTLTIAQQTKKGHVYVISNIGSFGEGVYKIGQTRRPDPQERIDELGDASVPFEFDVHALIESDNAPALEHKLHKQLLATQVNKINPRKEFFRVKLAKIREEFDNLNQGGDFIVKTWTETAIAAEYKESLDIENDSEKKAKWLNRQAALTDRQLQLDALRISIPTSLQPIGDDEAT